MKNHNLLNKEASPELPFFQTSNPESGTEVTNNYSSIESIFHSPLEQPFLDEQVADGQTNQTPITLRVLMNNLTNLIFWERNPKLKGKPLMKGQHTLVHEWLTIRTNEVVPAMRHSSASFRISQLLFFHRHPSVKGRFKTLPKRQQDRFQKIFNNINRNEVRPLFGLRLARGSFRSRTIFVIDDPLFQALPSVVRTSCGNELADVFAFVGKSQSSLSLKVVFVKPHLLPEGFNFSDAVVRVVPKDITIELNQALRAQMKNLIQDIREKKIRMQSSQLRRFTAVPDRVGVAVHNKHTIRVGTQSLALPIMASVVNLNEVLTIVLDDFRDQAKRLNRHKSNLSREKLILAKNQLIGLQKAINHPFSPKKWPKNQQVFLGEVLGRVMAHEVRHLYVLPHSADGLGGDSPQLTGNPRHKRFTSFDQSKILNNISQLERNQGSADVINTFALERRGFDFDFPF